MKRSLLNRSTTTSTTTTSPITTTSHISLSTNSTTTGRCLRRHHHHHSHPTSLIAAATTTKPRRREVEVISTSIGSHCWSTTRNNSTITTTNNTTINNNTNDSLLRLVALSNNNNNNNAMTTTATATATTTTIQQEQQQKRNKSTTSSSDTNTDVVLTSIHENDIEYAKSLTYQILNYNETPIGTIVNTTLWLDVEDVLRWWLQKSIQLPYSKTKTATTTTTTDTTTTTKEEAIEICFHLLDRLTEELPKNDDILLFSYSILDTELLNLLLTNWRNCIRSSYITNNNNNNNNKRKKNKKKQVTKNTEEEEQLLFHEYLKPSIITNKIEQYRWCSLLQPDAKSYNFILDVSATYYKNNPKVDGVYFIESLVEKLFHISQQQQQQHTNNSNNNELLVNVFTIGVIVKAWAYSGLVEGPKKATLWLERCRELSSSSSSNNNNNNNLSILKPNAIIYSTVIHGWAQSGNVERAEEIFELQLNDYFQNGNIYAKPDNYSFNKVLSAWSKSNRRDAPIRANTILRHMVDISSSSSSNHNNDEVSFSNNINWEDNYNEEDSIFSTTMAKYDTHFYNHNNTINPWEDCKPDMYSWCIVLACWSNYAKKNPTIGIQMAEQTLLEMLSNHSTINESKSAPWTIALNTLLLGYAQGKDPQRAQYVLEQLLYDNEYEYEYENEEQEQEKYDYYHENGDDDNDNNQELLIRKLQESFVRPDQISFNTVLGAYSKSDDHIQNAPLYVETLFKKMKNGTFDFQPCIVSYGSVMQCWAKYAKHMTSSSSSSNDDNKTNNNNYYETAASKAALRVEELYYEIVDEYNTTNGNNFKPNTITKNIVLQAWLHAAMSFTNKKGANWAVSRAENFLMNEICIHNNNNNKKNNNKINNYYNNNNKYTNQSSSSSKPKPGFFFLLLRIIAAAKIDNKAERVDKLYKLMIQNGVTPAKAEWSIIQRLRNKQQAKQQQQQQQQQQQTNNNNNNSQKNNDNKNKNHHQQQQQQQQQYSTTNNNNNGRHNNNHEQQQQLLQQQRSSTRIIYEK